MENVWKTRDQSGKDGAGAVGLIWRQIIESVCVHLHLCSRVVHLTSSDICGWHC
jgi:hypothetical protein